MATRKARRRRRNSTIAIALVAVAAVAVVLVVRANAGGSGIASAADAAESGLPVIELGEMYVEGALTVKEGASVAVVNEGAAPHNLVIFGGPTTPDLTNGQAAELDLSELEPDNYLLFCSIAGHKEAGMEAVLTVEPG
jgi:uncharacterized cupredoxin-like copper-binding protein